MRMKWAALTRRLDVDAAGQHHRLVGDDADHVAVEAGEADHHVLGPQFMHLEEAAVVHELWITWRTS
jgi:hypothetical protein